MLEIGEANRERLPYKFVITRSMRQGELIIFTEEKWERFVEERLQVLRTAGSRAGNMLNIYFKAYAMEHEGNDDLLDLPEALIEQLVRNNVLDTKDQIVLEDNLEDSLRTNTATGGSSTLQIRCRFKIIIGECEYMSNTIKYTPRPINTEDIELPDGLVLLTEKIAANVHDVWAAGRISEGWRYGEKKDTDKKLTPLLVPYDELPESEKEYDRNTALETLRLIIKLGYRIEK